MSAPAVDPALWPLDPGITFLNHGSFGSCPRAVLGLQQQLRERCTRRIDHRFQVAHEELDRLALEPIAQPLLRFEHGPRAAPERAVIEKNDARVERPDRRIDGRCVHYLAIPMRLAASV